MSSLISLASSRICGIFVVCIFLLPQLQSFVPICSVDPIYSIKLDNLQRNLFCEESCKDNIEINGNLTPTLVFYYDNHSSNELSSLLHKLSNCKLQTFLVESTNLQNVRTVCEKQPLTVVVDMTDKRVFSSLESYIESSDCYAVKLTEKYRKLENLNTFCPNITWLKKNDTKCLPQEKNKNIFRLCSVKECNVLRNRKFRVATVEYIPFVKKAPLENGTIDNSTQFNYRGIVFEILNEVANQYHFNYSIVEPTDQEYGISVNGSWNGMISMLLKQEVDIVAAGLTVTMPRSQVIDFTTPFYTDAIGIMIHAPGRQDMLWKLFSLFSLETWISILAVSFGSIFVIYILEKYAVISKFQSMETLKKSSWYVFGCLTNQGVDESPSTWSMQTFLAFWSLSSFALISIYSGGLIAMLTTSQLVTPFNDLTGLARAVTNGEYKICVENGTSFYGAILNADNEEYNMLKRWLDDNPFYVQPNDYACMDLLLKTPNLAYLGEVSGLTQMQVKWCLNASLMILKETFLPGSFAFALQKGSILNSVISSKIMALTEAGLITAWKQKYSEKPKFCKIYEQYENIGAESKKLSMTSFGGAFVVLSIGLAISVLAFCGEYKRIESCVSDYCNHICLNLMHLKRIYPYTRSKKE